MDTITILGISLLFFYSLTQILQFYGIDPSIFAIYIIFYVFLIISKLILPSTYPSNFADDIEEPEPIDDADDADAEADDVPTAKGTGTGTSKTSYLTPSSRPISSDRKNEIRQERAAANSSSSFFGSLFGSSTPETTQVPASQPQTTQAPASQPQPQTTQAQQTPETQTTTPPTGGPGTGDGFAFGSLFQLIVGLFGAAR